jgi:16S rRNA (guanine527-N7)-methyltransferase
VHVVRGRAEAHAGAGFDAVTARAVAPLDRLVGWGLPLVRRGGVLVAIKGASADAELAAARPALEALGALSSRVRELSFCPQWSGVLAVEVFAGETVPPGKPRQQRARRRRS